jgi:hypothetical protein
MDLGSAAKLVMRAAAGGGGGAGGAGVCATGAGGAAGAATFFLHAVADTSSPAANTNAPTVFRFLNMVELASFTFSGWSDAQPDLGPSSINENSCQRLWHQQQYIHFTPMSKIFFQFAPFAQTG